MHRLLMLVLSLLSLPALADEAAIRKAFAERYPNFKVDMVGATPVAGIYEVWGSGKLVYTDDKGDYLLVGPLVDTRTKTNLSQQRISELRAVKFDTLPLDKAFPIVKGKGERVIAVFSDPECPFCKRLEKELAQLDNLKTHIFLYPIANLHPQAPEIAKNIWCASDRGKTWSDYMLDGKAPAAVEKCQAPLDEIAQLAARIGVEGTPAIIFSNGKRIDGYVPAAKIEEMLKGGS